MKIALTLPLLVIVAVTAGCGSKVSVHSDTYWTGTVDGHVVAGHGNASFKNESVDCDIFQKSTAYGFLEAKIERTGGIMRNDGESAKTTEEFGIVRVCGK